MVITLQLIYSIGLTVFFTLFFGLVSSALDFWIPIVIFIGCFLGVTALYFLHLEINHLFTNRKKIVTKPQWYAQNIFKYGVCWINMYVRARLHVENGELIDPKQKYIFICNHKSNFDPICLLTYFNKSKMAFVSKEANFKIPFVGGIIHKAGCVALDRENPREGLKALRHAADLVKNNDLSMVIYPEGTRNKGDGMLPFRSGALRLAQMADVPIAVVVTKNTDLIHKNAPFHHTDVFMKVVEIIPLEKVQSTNATILSDEIREKMIKELEVLGQK